MQIKTIFLFFVFGAVAVLAKRESTEATGISQEKGSNVEEENSNESENENEYSNGSSVTEVNLKSTSKPSALPLKAKGQQNQLWVQAKHHIDEFTKEGHKAFLKKQKEITDKKEKYEDLLKSNLGNAEHNLRQLMEQQEKRKNTAEFQKCLYGHYFSFGIDMEKSIQSAFNCFENAVQNAKEFLERFKDVFDQILAERIGGIKEQTMISESCQKKKNKCVPQRIAATTKKIKELGNATTSLFKKTIEALKSPNKDMDDCRNEFLEKLVEKKIMYVIFITSCGGKDKPGVDEEDEEKVEEDKKEEEKIEEDKKEEKEKVEEHKKEEKHDEKKEEKAKVEEKR